MTKVVRLIIPFFLLLSSGLSTFLLLEFSLRFLGFRGEPSLDLSQRIVAQADHTVDWTYKPNSSFRSEGVDYSINSLGLRDLPVQQSNDGSQRTIVVLGDSVAEGYGVPFEEVFTSQLRRIYPKHRFINVAQSGLNAPQIVRLLELKGLQFGPVHVIWNFVLNDCDFYSRLSATESYLSQKDSEIGLIGIKINPKLKKILKSSALIYLLKQRTEYVLGRVRGRSEENHYRKIWKDAANRAKVEFAFEQLEQLSRRYNFEVTLLIWPLLVANEQYPLNDVHIWIGTEAKKRGFHVLDLGPALMNRPARLLQVTPEDNIHPNSLGHTLAVNAYVSHFGEILE